MCQKSSIYILIRLAETDSLLTVRILTVREQVIHRELNFVYFFLYRLTTDGNSSVKSWVLLSENRDHEKNVSTLKDKKGPSSWVYGEDVDKKWTPNN